MEFCWRACRPATPKTWCRTSSCPPCASFAAFGRPRHSGDGSPLSRAIGQSITSANARRSEPTWTKQSERKQRVDGGAEDAFLVLDLIRKLPEAYRETLIFRLVEGMTGPEIAAKTGLTPESVRVNLCRGMKMLRELLGGMETK